MYFEEMLKNAEKHDYEMEAIEKRIDPLIKKFAAYDPSVISDKDSYERTNEWWIRTFDFDDKTREYIANKFYNSPSDPANIILAAITFGAKLMEAKKENLLSSHSDE